jgi:phosphoglucosamine mutase
MARLFGTDGVRGVAITELTCEMAMKIGMAAVAKLGNNPTVIIGKDTRKSSDILEAALVSGITAAGGEAVLLGVVPTPAVAFLVRKHSADAGVMITASHNSAEFNGIKLFNKEGLKLADELEDEIQLLVESPDKITLKEGGEVGSVTKMNDAVDEYVSDLLSLYTEKTALKILIDCANGSACSCSEKVFENIDCTIINSSPNGLNINDRCGSTYMTELAENVLSGGFDLGIAFDGDADRMLAVDHNGVLVGGDKIIALLAGHMREKGELNSDTVVVTVMSNLGFHQYMKEHNVKVEVVQVGDRYVLEKMMKDDFSIGGEQSGHIIFKKHATTGDGILSAIKLLNMLSEKKSSLAEMVSEIPTFPQTLKNVVISPESKGKWESNGAVTATIKEVETAMNGVGRILIRESGTEPLLRVMIEGKVQEEIEAWAGKICDVAKVELGG